MPETLEQDEQYELEMKRRRSRRIAEMKRKKRQQEVRRELFVRLCPIVFVIVFISFLLTRIFSSGKEEAEPVADAPSDNTTIDIQQDDSIINIQNNDAVRAVASLATALNSGALSDKPAAEPVIYSAVETDSTDQFFDADKVFSKYGIMIDLTDNTILAQQNAHARMNPASMTKILTVLVAAEHISDLDDTFTITQEINDYVYSHGSSAAYFENNETVTVRDLFYGTVLPSGGDAALGLAYYVAGSQEAFVELMNDKLEELGLSSSTHFTNCIGLYDENHYSTAYDMAMIMDAAIHNELCREVLSAHKYTTSSTPEHLTGLELSNWFLRRIEDKDTHGEVICAKTGYVVQSGHCAASYGTDSDGNGYIIVTGDAHSPWRCIYDHVALYQKYLGSG